MVEEKGRPPGKNGKQLDVCLFYTGYGSKRERPLVENGKKHDVYRFYRGDGRKEKGESTCKNRK